MDKSHGSCECCEKWYQKHIALKRAVVERSLQITRFLQLDQENSKLKEELRDMHELSQTLRADCAGYKQEMCAMLAELSSLQQLSSSQCAELARLNQERDEAYQARQEAQTSLQSCQATLRQYEALIQKQQEEAKDKARRRSKTQENRVSMLEKKLRACTRQAKQARSQHKKAMGWFRGFLELVRHPDEDLQCGARQLEAFLEGYGNSTQELTEEDLIARVREMQVPDPLSPLPPSPQSHSVQLSASSEPEPPTPWPELSPSAVPSDHVLLAPSSEQMPLECPSEPVQAEPVYNVNTLISPSELVPPALLSEPVLPTVLHCTASQVKSLGPVSLLPHQEPSQQVCLSKSVPLGPPLEPLLPTCSSDTIPQATLSTSTPLAPMSDPVRLAQHLESAPPVSVESEPASVISLSEPAAPASSWQPEPTSTITLSESAAPASSLKPEPTSVIALSEPAPPASLKPEPTLAPPAFSLEPEPTSVIAPSEPAASDSSFEIEPTSVKALSELAPPALSLNTEPPLAPRAVSLEQEPTSVTALSEPASPASSLKPEPTSVIALSEPALPASSVEGEPTAVVAVSELAAPACLLRPVIPEPSPVLALASSSLDLAPPAPLSKPVVMTSSLEFVQQASVPARLVQRSETVLPPPLLEPVSRRPTKPKLPALTSEPAYTGLKSLANKPLRRSSRIEQQLCVQASRKQERSVRNTGVVTRLSEKQSAGPACKPLTDKSSVRLEKLALEGEQPLEAVRMDVGLSLRPELEQRSSPKEVHEEGQLEPLQCLSQTRQQEQQELVSAVKVLPKRKQWVARNRQSPPSVTERTCALRGTREDQQLMTPQLKQAGHEQPRDSKKRLVEGQHHAATSKKTRLSKRQLRELFSSSSEEDEASAAEESAYTAFLSSAEHRALSRAASGKLHATKTAHAAMSKLSWLAMQPEVRPGVVASFVRNVKRDALVYAALVYLGRCKANPVAAYCRGEQAPPLITKLEVLLLEALALKPDGFAALLSSLQARFSSPQKPTRMLAQASYVRLMCAVCSHLREHNVARVAAWDLMRSDHAPFLVASAVGAWPGLLSALPPGPLQRAVSYILLRSPGHTLNNTLKSQAHKVLCELGPLGEFVGDERALVEELLDPLLPPHRRCRDVCLTHCLALEQLCRRSPADLLSWMLEQRLGPQMQSVLGQPHAACLVRLLGLLWKHYEKAAVKLETLLSQLESFPCHGEDAFDIVTKCADKATLLGSCCALPEPEPVPDLASEQMAEEGSQATLKVQEPQSPHEKHNLEEAREPSLQDDSTATSPSLQSKARCRRCSVGFSSFTDDAFNRRTVASTFGVLLRLHKCQLVHLSQHQPYGPIVIEVNQQEEGTLPMGQQPTP